MKSFEFRAERAFTLTELLIAMAIIAILATLALPSYRQQLREARRTDGQNALLELAVAQERFRAGCPDYATQIAATRSCSATDAARNALIGPSTSRRGHYRLTLERPNSQSGFSAVATAVGNQSHDCAKDVSCARLTIDQDGTRLPAECWR